MTGKRRISAWAFGALTLALLAVPIIREQAAATHARAAGRPESECSLRRGRFAVTDPRLPAQLRLPEVQVVGLHTKGDMTMGSLNARTTVEDALRATRARFEGTAYRVVSEDFEGFEAELYLRTEEGFGVIRFFESSCTGHVLIGFQLPAVRG